MSTYLRALGAAAVVAGVLAMPSTAAFAADDKPLLNALTERDATGALVVYPIHQGESIPIQLGVANVGTTPAAGLVVKINTYGDVDQPQKFSNCRYYVDGDKESTYCTLDHTLAAQSGSYALAGFRVAAAPDAHADKLPGILFQWYSKAEVDAQGGVDALAKLDLGPDKTGVAGTEGTLRLESKQMFISPHVTRNAFAYVRLVTTPTTAPTSSSPTPSSPAPASSSAAPVGGSGGGLPVTGAKAATFAGAGAALLIAGVVGLLIARRRRTRFLA